MLPFQITFGALKHFLFDTLHNMGTVTWVKIRFRGWFRVSGYYTQGSMLKIFFYWPYNNKKLMK